MRIRTYAPEPTTAPPGTAAKEAVLCERQADGFLLFHPADARYEGDTLPLEWLKWKQAVRRQQQEAFLDKIKGEKH